MYPSITHSRPHKKQKLVYGMFIDVVKAFDSVSHESMLLAAGLKDMVLQYVDLCTRYTYVTQGGQNAWCKHKSVDRGETRRSTLIWIGF